MPVGPGAVLVGEAAPRAEAHDVLVVAEENRRAVRSRRLEQRVERGLEHLAELARSRHRVGEAVDRVEVAYARAQLLALAHVARGTENETEFPVLSEYLRAVDLEPCVRAARAAQPDGHGIDVRAGVELFARGGGSGEIVGIDQILDRDTGERVRIPPERQPRRRGVNDRARQIAENDEVVRALDDEPTDGVVDVLRVRVRFDPATRHVPPGPRSGRRSLHYSAAPGQGGSSSGGW